MLDGPHKLALRGVERGILDDGSAPAVRNLAVAGLIEPVDGVWRLTQAGHAVLELEGGLGTSATDAATDLKAKIRDWFMT